jgi:HK97 family phage major capsid protein
MSWPLAQNDDPMLTALRREMDDTLELARKSDQDLAREQDRLISSGIDLTAPANKSALSTVKDLQTKASTAQAKAAGAQQVYLEHVESTLSKRGDGKALAMFAKSLLESSGSGSFVAPPEHANYIFDRLAATSVGLRSGFSVISTDAQSLEVPRVLDDVAANWVGEAQPISDDEPNIDSITATPRKLAALVVLSNELAHDSRPDVIEKILNGNVLRSMALKLDLGFFEGSGIAPEILGLSGVEGVHGVELGSGDGAAFEDLDPILEAISLLSESDATATAIVCHPAVWGQLSKLRENNTDSLKPLLGVSAGSPTAGIARSLFGLPVLLSSQLSASETVGMSDNCASVWVYDAPEIVAVRRSDVSLETDSSAFFTSDQVALRAISRWDLAVPHAEAICRITGVIVPAETES